MLDLLSLSSEICCSSIATATFSVHVHPNKECDHPFLAQQVVGPVDRLAVTFEDL